MVTTAELQRRGLPYAVVVDGAATTASLQALDRQGLPYLVEVADGATMASRQALEARGLRYLVPVLVDATAASKASLAAQGLRYAVQVDADILPADRLVLQRQGLACYVEVDSSGNSVSVAAVGGAALLVGETNGFATDFTHGLDAERVAVKTAGTVVASGLDAFYQNSGTSPKQVYDVNGTLVWSPHNMFLNSAAPVTQSVTTVVGQNYTVTVIGTGTMTGSAGSSGVATGGSPLTYTATTTTSTFTKAGTVTQIQMNRGAVATAYLATTAAIRNGLALDYDPVTHAAKGLLCEPAATNLQSVSENLSALTVGGGTVTLDNQVSPSGLTTADTFTEDTATSIHGAYGSGPSTANADYTISRFYKMGTRRYATVGWSDGTNGAYAVYDLQSGVVGSSAAIGTGTLNSSSIQSIGNGWYRCILCAKHPGTTGYYTYYAANAATITPDAFGRQSFLGTGSTLIHGPGQLETGTVATSPIPTFGATVTRAADNYTFLLSTIPALGAEYSVYCRFATPLPTNSRAAYAITDGSTAEYISVKAVTNVNYATFDGNVSQVNLTQGTIVSNTFISSAVRSKLNDSALSVAGAAATVDTVCTLPTVTEVRFGNAGNNAASIAVFNIGKLSIVPRAWSDVELAAKSAT